MEKNQPLNGAKHLEIIRQTALPEKCKRLWNLPGCLFYPLPKGVTWPVAIALQVWKAKRALRRAAQEQRLFHLWFHLFNLAANPERLLREMEKGSC